MSLAIEADLELDLAGHKAVLRATGKHLELRLARAKDLFILRQVSLPLPSIVSSQTSPFDLASMPNVLNSQGLSLTIADGQGALLYMGSDWQNNNLWLPTVGRLPHSQIASLAAFWRLLIARFSPA
ncbi:MAG: hypothetical protein AAF708_04675 [Deinococcota bacterium]